jgi:hypothetical protein
LSFLKDRHFRINYNFVNPISYPFFFRETAFQKTESGYQTADGKIVQSVEGYDDLDALFKRSISSEGKLVYYPILLKNAYWQDEEKICDEILTVHYTDGTSEELVSEPYQSDEINNTSEIVSMTQNGDIPVMQVNSWNTSYQEEIVEGATQLKNSAVSILDLRNNPGGSSAPVQQWFNSYCGSVSSNGFRLNVFTGVGAGSLQDLWVDHENLLIVLIGKNSASSSELFIDYAYNLENVLIIGENTFGALLGGGNYFQLPNSKCIVTSGGPDVYLKAGNDDYFEELRGFYPDIWVPAGEAEELAVKLIEHLKK